MADAVNDAALTFWRGGVVPAPPVTIYNKVPSWSDVGNTNAASIAVWNATFNPIGALTAGRPDALAGNNAMRASMTSAGTWEWYRAFTVGPTPTTPFVLSCYFKAGTLARGFMGIYNNNTSTYGACQINLTTGVVTVTDVLAGYTWTSVNAGGGWWRLVLTSNITLVAGHSYNIYLLDPTVVGNTVDVFGLQIEGGSVATTHQQILA